MTIPVIKYLSYEDVSGHLKAGLQAYGLDALINPGPSSDASLQKLSPQAILFVNVGGGPGLTNEQLFDRTFIALRAIGKQSDHKSAEQLAMTADRWLLALNRSMALGSTYTLGVTRTGGPPQLLTRDNANRYHFTSSYIATAATGL